MSYIVPIALTLMLILIISMTLSLFQRNFLLILMDFRKPFSKAKTDYLKLQKTKNMCVTYNRSRTL